MYQHVKTTFEKTIKFIEENADDEQKASMIQDMTTKDLQQSLVLILDNLGRQKAYAALEIYHEHD